MCCLFARSQPDSDSAICYGACFSARSATISVIIVDVGKPTLLVLLNFMNLGCQPGQGCVVSTHFPLSLLIHHNYNYPRRMWVVSPACCTVYRTLRGPEHLVTTERAILHTFQYDHVQLGCYRSVLSVSPVVSSAYAINCSPNTNGDFQKMKECFPSKIQCIAGQRLHYRTPQLNSGSSSSRTVPSLAL